MSKGRGGRDEEAALPLKPPIRQQPRMLRQSRRCKLALLLYSSAVLSFLLVPAALRLRAISSRLVVPPPPSSRSSQGYTLVINTWKRNELLKKSVGHFAACPGVVSIHIVWSEPSPPSSLLRHQLTRKLRSATNGTKEIDLTFDVNEENSLNNRFKAIDNLRTDAVFSVDDDVIVPCATVEFAYNVWRSAPSTMVGFVPRMHWLRREKGAADSRYKYGGWWSVWWKGTYSIVLSKAAFFHKRYLDLYTNHMPAAIREYVTKNRNCEDIAMSFLVANVSEAPPIWVKGKIREIGSSGISSASGHRNHRSECLNTFAAMYGYMPLLEANMKAADSRKSWIW